MKVSLQTLHPHLSTEIEVVSLSNIFIKNPLCIFHFLLTCLNISCCSVLWYTFSKFCLIWLPLWDLIYKTHFLLIQILISSLEGEIHKTVENILLDHKLQESIRLLSLSCIPITPFSIFNKTNNLAHSFLGYILPL